MDSFLTVIEGLKNIPRRGWVKRGVPEPESVADHMYRMAMILLAFPWEDPADKHTAVEMAIVHDAPEAICGDITPSDGISPESKHQREKLGLLFLDCLVRRSDPKFADRIGLLWKEYEEHQTFVARIVHEVDKYEALHQAYLYSRRHPHLDLRDFKKCRAAIRDPWLARQADQALHLWEGLEQRKKSTLRIIFVIGGPGVGKGTQCALAAEELNFEHISVGALLRREQASPGSPFADFIRESFRLSIVVPPTLAMMVLEPELEEAQKRGKAGILLDGFPRSVDQLRQFEEQISGRYSTIAMDCPPEILHQRLLIRAESSGREDDTPDSIQKRIETFEDSHRPILENVCPSTLRRVDCSGSVDQVRNLFTKAVQEIREQEPGAS